MTSVSLPSQTKYDRVAIAIHWITAALMIFMVFFGEELMETGERGENEGIASTFLPSLHVNIGIIILLLTVVRVLWRVINPPPPLPATMAPWEVMITKIVHAAFYVLMIGLPLTGWFAFGEFVEEHSAMAGVRLLGLVDMPASPGGGDFAGDIHEVGSKIAMVLIILHVVAALKHQFINRDGLLRRMSPH